MTQVPLNKKDAAETIPSRRRRRRFSRQRALELAVPYALILPVIVALGAVLGYPMYRLVVMSFQKYDLPQIVAHKGVWIGLDNYRLILGDQLFWHVLLRSAIFTAANVGLTIVGGTLIALLLLRIHPVMRVLLTSGLILVWSMPPVVAVQIWRWMINYDNGVLNYMLSGFQTFGGYYGHDWLATPFWQLTMVTTLIVWGALPFVVVTVYAGLAQVPAELVEAAQVDGARSWRTFRDVTFPILRPIFLILTSLSIIWDFGVFTQAWLLITNEQTSAGNFIMGTYLYKASFQATEYGKGAAISLIILLIVAVMSVFYVRKMVQIGDVE